MFGAPQTAPEQWRDRHSTEKTGMEKINYSTLGAEVEAWRKGYLDNVRRTCGEEYAEASARDLDADPWLALRWYLEDRRRGLETGAAA